MRHPLSSSDQCAISQRQAGRDGEPPNRNLLDLRQDLSEKSIPAFNPRIRLFPGKLLLTAANSTLPDLLQRLGRLCRVDSLRA
jgi:hypothetical protein